jgi:hypothetical protein
MIIDTFMFYNEFDILEIRLEELYDVVDYFVIVEGSHTHTGMDKRVNFLDNIQRYSKYMDKIKFSVTDIPYPNGPKDDMNINWIRENYHRDVIRNEINKLQLEDHDIIVSSDLDEIVDSELLNKIRNKTIEIKDGIFYRLELDLYYYNIETKSPTKWYHSKLFTYSTLKNTTDSLTRIRFINDGPNSSMLSNAGWHLSSFGDKHAVYTKLGSIAEAPLDCVSNARNIEFLDEQIKNKRRFFDNVQLIHVPLKENTYLPKYYKTYKPVKVSIACLIYKSVRWLQFVKEQVEKFTNLDENEFYFVANDACDEVLNYLKNNNIHHYIHTNTEEQRKEWYINNVYRAWNTAGRVAKGEYVVFINSDMAFSPGWLDRLMLKYDDTKIVMSRLVERGVLRSGLYGIEKNFGNVPRDYKESEFVEYAKSIAENNLYPSGLYMPCLIKKRYLEAIQYFPEGNIVPGSDIFKPQYAKRGEACIPGDQVFIKKLNTIGITHWSAFDSIVYHFQEGEMRDTA